MKDKQNQAIIIGDSFNNTLGLIRSIGEAQIHQTLILVGKNDPLFVGKSKYLRKEDVYRVDTLSECMPLLNSLAEPSKRQIILCTNDNAATFVDENEEKLHQQFITPMNGKTIGKLMNKAEQCELAERCGLKVPKSFIHDIRNEFPENSLKYPLLLKPLYSVQGEKSDIHICKSSEEVNMCLTVNSHCQQFIVQEFIQKEYEINLLGVSTEHGVLIPGGVKKIRHYPTVYSPCSYGLYQSTKQLGIDTESAKAFITQTGYKGLFSIELLHKGCENYFMEINFRNDGLAYAATAAGINLPAIYIQNKTLPINIQVKDTYMMDLSIDYCHVKDGTISFGKWLRDFLRTGCMLNFNSRDVAPTLHYYLSKLQKKVHR